MQSGRSATASRDSHRSRRLARDACSSSCYRVDRRPQDACFVPPLGWHVAVGVIA
jgi:hypothetical protein